MKKNYLITNWILSLLVIIGDIFYIIYNDLLWLKSITSIGFVLIGCINLVFVYKNNYTNKKFPTIMVLGLFFAMLGDIMLEIIFILGAGLFAIGHVFYFFAYTKLINFNYKDLIPGAIIFIPVTLFIIFAPFFDFGGIVMEIVCIVYAIIISLMVGKSITNFIKEKNAINLILMIGSLLFLFSDFVLLLNVFGSSPSIILTILCLASYYPAQCVLAHSLLYFKNEK